MSCTENRLPSLNSAGKLRFIRARRFKARHVGELCKLVSNKRASSRSLPDHATPSRSSLPLSSRVGSESWMAHQLDERLRTSLDRGAQSQLHVIALPCGLKYSPSCPAQTYTRGEKSVLTTVSIPTEDRMSRDLIPSRSHGRRHDRKRNHPMCKAEQSSLFTKRTRVL